MSSPNTDLEKQAQRHKPSILGITIAVVLAAIVVAIVLMVSPNSDDASDSGTISSDEPQINQDKLGSVDIQDSHLV